MLPIYFILMPYSAGIVMMWSIAPQIQQILKMDASYNDVGPNRWFQQIQQFQHNRKAKSVDIVLKLKNPTTTRKFVVSRTAYLTTYIRVLREEILILLQKDYSGE
ncbi:hypothetical protein LOAG_00575 [Loa loa]|uniref:Uncharacterized protein n=1 Tax=Loa loa TaxID=7209 RepID=A0A1S0UB44_LOALO|nr:hypothetical protein LOAG_00575 [Loa loa]EFO27914.1 hypothetical protein LOAG_00575 [Loa loa]